MILVAAAVLWLIVLLGFSFTPRLEVETRRNAQLDLAALGALGILTAGFFWQLLFTSDVWMPAGGGDLAGFIYPTYHFAQAWLTRGVIPLWDPYIFGGTPFVGDIQTALFYPINLLTYFLSNPITFRDLEYLSVLHFYIAGAGMFLFLRYGLLRRDKQPLNRFAALAGATAFAFSDLFIIHFGNLNLIATAAWLPLVMLFFAQAMGADAQAETGMAKGLARFGIGRKSVMFALLSSLTLAVAFFAGHIQPFLFIVLVVALYVIYGVVIEKVDWKRGATLLVLTLGVTVGLAAMTLLPGLELTRLSVRTAFTYQDAAQFSLPPIELVGMLVPGFFGRGPENAWGPWSRVEVGYLGVLPLLLAIFALVLRRNARTMFYALIAVVGLVLALGGFAIVQGWLFQFVPGFGELRAPARFVFVMDFGLATLAAIGFDALVEPMADAMRATFRKTVRGAAWVALVVAVASGALALGILILGQGQDPALFQRIGAAANALGFFILLLGFSFALLLVLARGWLSARVWSGLAVALIFFDVFSLGAYVDYGTSDPTLGYQRQDVVDFLRASAGLARIDSRTDVEGVWKPETGLLYGLQDVYGDNPLVLNDFDTFWNQLGGRDKAGYALLNVKYVLTSRGAPMPANFVKAFDGAGGITVWENKTALPRAWMVGTTRVDNNLENIRGELQRGEIDPKQTAVLSGDGAREVSGNAGDAAVTITGYSPNIITGQVNAPSDGYVILSEMYTLGWRAFVDGAEVPVVRADALVRAFPMTAGQHQFEMVYDPLTFKVGAIVSLITLVGVLGVLGWMWLKREPTQ